MILYTFRFYEWKNQSIDKQPFFIKSEKSDVIYLAGLYTSCKNENDEILYTFTICTGKSPSKFSKIHPRIPIILKNEEEIDKWINPTNKEYKKYLIPNEDNLIWYQVSSKINKDLDINDPSNIEKINVTSLNSFFTPIKKDDMKMNKDEKEDKGENELKKKRNSSSVNNNKDISNFFKKIKKE